MVRIRSLSTSTQSLYCSPSSTYPRHPVIFQGDTNPQFRSNTISQNKLYHIRSPLTSLDIVMTTSLESLVEELLVRIISFTDCHSLPSLALVSRKLNRLTTLELYASIDFKEASIDTGTRFLIPVTYHLLTNPDLAALVRSVSLRNVFGDEEYLVPLNEGADNDFRKGWPLSPDQKALDDLIWRAVEDVEDNIQRQAKLYNAVRAGSDESSIIAILISKLPNLRTLDVVGDTMRAAGCELLRFVKRVVKREAPFDEKPVLTKLSDILVCGCNYNYPNSSELLGACLELPSIRRLYAYHLGNDEHNKITETIAALGTDTSLVEELELRGSHLYAPDLDRVLKSCKYLKTFIYEVGPAWTWYPLRTSDIMNSMTAVEKTLENLVLEHSKSVANRADDGDGELTAVSLAMFKQLQYLKISTLFLGGFKQDEKVDFAGVFPTTLTILHLTYVGDLDFCAPWIPLALQRAFENGDAVLPNLKKLTLQGAFLDNPNRLDDIKGLVRTMRKREVEVVIEGVNPRIWDERGWGIDEEVKWKKCLNNYAYEVATLNVERNESDLSTIKSRDDDDSLGGGGLEL
ncbi:hypothetical protein BKA65DRAFT_513494 [Rhexocercosporidium sp. MPI-PUGE-AT-0058]|nr:hypothetical protein BKA65DRAFT_513494 [Rhexocercosporidium sp. MPI-PUGE-AT-0058]